MVDSYLAEVGARLHGPTKARADVLEEIRAGLIDSIERLESRGHEPADAAHAAVAEHGSAAAVADAFAGELAVVHARHVLRILLFTGPLVGIWWLLLLAPADWRLHPGLLIAAIPVLPLVAAAVATIVLVLATTGTLIRWVPESTPRHAVSMTALVGIACVVGDVALLTILLVRTTTGTAASLVLALAAAAALASLIRLPFAIWATSSSLRIGRRLRQARTATQ